MLNIHLLLFEVAGATPKIMNSDFLHATTLKTASIQQVNDALIVLRHFVELNHRLLPLLYALHEKEEPSERDISDIDKIKNVFDSYHFDVNASVVLMNSPILELIRKSYHSITAQGELRIAHTNLHNFKLEFSRLKSSWNEIVSN